MNAMTRVTKSLPLHAEFAGPIGDDVAVEQKLLPRRHGRHAEDQFALFDAIVLALDGADMLGQSDDDRRSAAGHRRQCHRLD